MEQHIIPECYIDTSLVKALIPPKVRYNHQHGCSNVAKHMQNKLKGDFALGVIDKDKKAIKYLDDCQPVYEYNGFLQLLKHKTENHYLIIIRPAMEQWILNTTALTKLTLSQFALPDDLDRLCKITKTAKGDKEDPNASKFTQFFRELKRCNPQPIAVLRFWIHYLKSNPYSVDIMHLISETDALLNES